MNTYQPAVEIDHLRKTYGTLVAVDDVSVSVAEGEIFGILGPNGAGKTTAIECAIGLRQPDAGTVRLLGLDPRSDRAEIHQIVGVQLQASAFPAKLRVGGILDMYRSFYRHPADVSELTGALGLAGKHGDYYRSLSGGQRQRLSVALALIGRPRLAFLDEMTTGLDPQARRDAGTSATTSRLARRWKRSRIQCEGRSRRSPGPRRCCADRVRGAVRLPGHALLQMGVDR